MLPVKIHVDSYSFDIAESEYDNQIALSPASVQGERMEPSAIFIGGSCHVFRGKNPHGNAENEVSVTCYTP
jgi:hypothetical protein